MKSNYGVIPNLRRNDRGGPVKTEKAKYFKRAIGKTSVCYLDKRQDVVNVVKQFFKQPNQQHQMETSLKSTFPILNKCVKEITSEYPEYKKIGFIDYLEQIRKMKNLDIPLLSSTKEIEQFCCNMNKGANQSSDGLTHVMENGYSKKNIMLLVRELKKISDNLNTGTLTTFKEAMAKFKKPNPKSQHGNAFPASPNAMLNKIELPLPNNFQMVNSYFPSLHLIKHFNDKKDDKCTEKSFKDVLANGNFNGKKPVAMIKNDNVETNNDYVETLNIEQKLPQLFKFTNNGIFTRAATTILHCLGYYEYYQRAILNDMEKLSKSKDGDINYDQLKEMKNLDETIKEFLRISSPNPCVLIKLIENCSLTNNESLKKDTFIAFNTSDILKDDSLFSTAKQIKLNRLLNAEAKFYLRFLCLTGNCNVDQFLMMSLKLFTILTLRKYKIKTNASETDIQNDEILNNPENFELEFRPR